jgi:5-methylcytosine-specific restriction enzyme A
MSSEFSAQMLTFFQADRGAYSKVTSNENEKSQVTFTGPEQDLVEDFLGSILDGRHGNIADIKAKGIDPDLEYRLFPSGKTIRLTTSYKTNKPNELRYYLRKDVFKPEAGWNWAIFEREGALWLADFSADFLSKIESGLLLNERRELLEREEDDFQLAINKKDPPDKSKKETWSYNRNGSAARKALENAAFKCELFPSFPTFTSLASSRPFMEAHHLIPMKMQDQFDISIDVEENICCLNPLSHRMLHHGCINEFEAELAKVAAQRSKFLESVGWIEDDLMSLYATS